MSISKKNGKLSPDSELSFCSEKYRFIRKNNWFDNILIQGPFEGSKY